MYGSVFRACALALTVAITLIFETCELSKRGSFFGGGGTLCLGVISVLSRAARPLILRRNTHALMPRSNVLAAFRSHRTPSCMYWISALSPAVDKHRIKTNVENSEMRNHQVLNGVLAQENDCSRSCEPRLNGAIEFLEKLRF